MSTKYCLYLLLFEIFNAACNLSQGFLGTASWTLTIPASRKTREGLTAYLQAFTFSSRLSRTPKPGKPLSSAATSLRIPNSHVHNDQVKLYDQSRGYNLAASSAMKYGNAGHHSSSASPCPSTGAIESTERHQNK
jgi:hypothetical protein